MFDCAPLLGGFDRSKGGVFLSFSEEMFDSWRRGVGCRSLELQVHLGEPACALQQEQALRVMVLDKLAKSCFRRTRLDRIMGVVELGVISDADRRPIG